MVYRRMFWVIICVLAAFFPVAYAQSASEEPLFSTLNAEAFYEIAEELYSYEYATDAEIEEAMIFLEAAGKLDPRAGYVYEGILTAAPKMSGPGYTEKIYGAFEEYIKSDIDLELAKKTVQQLLSDKNTRSEREEVLERLLRISAGKNDELSSELTAQLGIFAAERADLESARRYLERAYRYNPYNSMVFRNLQNVYENSGQGISPYGYARHLRFAMSVDPLDVNASMAFARYAEMMSMYDIAAAAYEYSARLFIYLKPEEPLASSIYTPWAISSYNAQDGWKTCVEIAKWLRSSGNMDMVIEALAGRAAIKAGETNEGQKILTEAAQNAAEKLNPDVISFDVRPIELAWFHCFGLPDAKRALVWANRAYSDDPQSVHVRAILAYCLVLGSGDEQSRQVLLQSAKEMLVDENGQRIYETNQIGALAMGLLMREEGNFDGAIELFKSALYMDRMSLAGEKAVELLDDMKVGYEEVDPPKELVAGLLEEFGDNVVPSFGGIEDIATIKFALDAASLAYGNSLDGNLQITNKRAEPIFFSDESMFKGYIRVDAEVSGDISVSIPNLISKRIRPTSAEQSKRISIPLRLTTGTLRRLLIAYPQASVDIEFTIYFDPIVTATGQITNRIDNLEPLKAKVSRPGVKMTHKFLILNLDMLSGGQFKQKIRAAKLFAGLMLEQDIQKKIALPYRVTKIDRSMLTSSVKRGLADENWVVNVQTMSSLMDFTPPFEYDIISGVSEKITDSNWPVRLLAVYLLNRAQGANFKSVLDWAGKNETNAIVREMITVLGGGTETSNPIFDPNN